MPEDNEGAVLSEQVPDGEGGDASGGNNENADPNLDDIYFGDDEEKPPDGQNAGETKDGKSAGDAKDGAVDGDSSKDVQQMMAEIEKLKSDKINLNRALHEERQQKKKPKSDDGEGAELTDAQLRDLMKEHHDDPDALFNLVQYMARNAAKKEKKAAVNEVEVASRRKDLESLVSQRTPDFVDPESPLRKQAEVLRGQLGLEDHPYGDFLSLGANTYLALPDIMKAAYAKGKDDAVKEAVEANRSKGIVGSKPTPKGGGTASASDGKLPKDVGAVAKQLGMSPSQARIYQRLVAGKGGSITVEG